MLSIHLLTSSGPIYYEHMKPHTQKNSHIPPKSGLATPLVLTIILAIAALAGAAFFDSRNRAELTPQVTPDPAFQDQAPSSGNGGSDAPAAGSQRSPFQPKGEVLAGTVTPFVKFNQEDYDQALRENRIIMLYFSANWCPICKVELSRTRAAFDELQLPNLVGFRVSFNDNETDDFDENLARQFGIAYQHTKVILKDGQQVLKNGDTWGKDRYITELTDVAQ